MRTGQPKDAPCPAQHGIALLHMFQQARHRLGLGGDMPPDAHMPGAQGAALDPGAVLQHQQAFGQVFAKARMDFAQAFTRHRMRAQAA